jgi:hypothetical protein
MRDARKRGIEVRRLGILFEMAAPEQHMRCVACDGPVAASTTDAHWVWRRSGTWIHRLCLLRCADAAREGPTCQGEV